MTTALLHRTRVRQGRRWPGSGARTRPRRRRVVVGGPVPPLSPRLELVRACLVLVGALAAVIAIHVVVLSRIQHATAQQRLYDRFRNELANGVIPVGPSTTAGVEIATGAPVAMIEIPTLGVSEIVGEGSSAGVLFDGPGHRRDTMLPGQVGTSVVFGRAAAYGGPFAGLDQLAPGDEVVATTGQGRFTYAVVSVRRAGDPLPAALAPGQSRLLLVTADGGPFVPSGILRVDTDLVGAPVVGPARAIAPGGLAFEERTMAGDPRTLWALALWLIAFAAVAVGLAWAWNRWGRRRTWIVGLPPTMLVCLAISSEVARLLPNLL